MGNSPSQAPAEGGEEEEKKQRETTASSSSSGLSMLEAGAVVAGTALLALGAWKLLSQSSSGDAADTEEDRGKRMLMGERVKGSTDDGGSYLQHFEGFQMPSSHGGSKLYTSPYLRSDQNVLKILSYNVWSGDVKLQERMEAIGDIIQEHSPDVICFQEITPEIYEIFENSNWWEAYRCSVSPEKSMREYFCMQLSKLPAKFSHKPIGPPTKERELCIAEVDVGMTRRLAFATSHLVSPNPPDRMYSTERVVQAKEALDHLKNYSNIIFGGDMNWDEEVDGPILLPRGWVDAWEKLRPGEDGWTFDTKANQMLSCNQPLQKRLDRFLCHLRGFIISGIEIIGTEAIPGLHYRKEKKVGRIVLETKLPVLPSDHFGLLLTIDTYE